ncbi:MAG TPA: sugar-binding protein [Pirellulales bacterium]|nr:sugar-binding protein [Pirellulales bacterium]
MTRATLSLALPLFLCFAFIRPASGEESPLESGVRGVATRAPGKVVIDGDLKEFQGAFCTPVGYFEPDTKNRAAQFFYMWDDEAFYAGLRTLDEKQANPAPDDRLWEGDGVEWYFDTRRGPDFRSESWGEGAVHMYWTAYKNAQIEPRWCLRPDMLKAIPGTGVEVAARKTSYGSETEFKLPWSNFPNFKVASDAVIGLDAELCYGDGAGRTYRTFAYGSPLSVTQPASQAKVQLVDRITPAVWRLCGAVMAPIRVDTPWSQPSSKALVTGMAAIPPDQSNEIGKIVFRLVDTFGNTVAEHDAKMTTLNAEGRFFRAEAQWPSDEAAPGTYIPLGIVYDREGKELCRTAPRLVSVNNSPGY